MCIFFCFSHFWRERACISLFRTGHKDFCVLYTGIHINDLETSTYVLHNNCALRLYTTVVFTHTATDQIRTPASFLEHWSLGIPISSSVKKRNRTLVWNWNKYSVCSYIFDKKYDTILYDISCKHASTYVCWRINKKLSVIL